MINEMESYVDKFKSFHWDAVEINGHDYNAIHEAILNAKAVQDKPSAIILHTIKGKRLHICRAHPVPSYCCVQRGYGGSFQALSSLILTKKEEYLWLSSNEQD